MFAKPKFLAELKSSQNSKEDPSLAQKVKKPR